MGFEIVPSKRNDPVAFEDGRSDQKDPLAVSGDFSPSDEQGMWDFIEQLGGILRGRQESVYEEASLVHTPQSQVPEEVVVPVEPSVAAELGPIIHNSQEPQELYARDSGNGYALTEPELREEPWERVELVAVSPEPLDFASGEPAVFADNPTLDNGNAGWELDHYSKEPPYGGNNAYLEPVLHHHENPWGSDVLEPAGVEPNGFETAHDFAQHDIVPYQEDPLSMQEHSEPDSDRIKNPAHGGEQEESGFDLLQPDLHPYEMAPFEPAQSLFDSQALHLDTSLMATEEYPQGPLASPAEEMLPHNPFASSEQEGGLLTEREVEETDSLALEPAAYPTDEVEDHQDEWLAGWEESGEPDDHEVRSQLPVHIPYKVVGPLIGAAFAIAACSPEELQSLIFPEEDDATAPRSAEVDPTFEPPLAPESIPLEEAPTPLAGGPDDELAVNTLRPWPSLTDVLVVRADGGPFSFDAEAPNVQAQLDSVRDLVSRSGWAIVSSPDQLTSGRTAFVAPHQDGDQWSIQALTSNGVMVPIRSDDLIMDRPDWATSDVARYDEIEHVLGSDFPARYELVNDHWVAVVRTGNGQRAGYYDIFSGEWVYDQAVVAIEVTPTPEPLPTSCLDPEVNGQVVAEYLANTEHSTFLEEMDAWRNSDDFKRNNYNLVARAGFQNGPSWYMSHNMKILGGYRFSLAEQSGFRDGDFAYCLLGASPHMVDDLVPMVIGMQRNGQWSQVVFIRDKGVVGVAPRAILDSPEQADAWIEKMRGEVIDPLIVLRFDKPYWERDTLWHVGYDSVLPLLRNRNGYIMRYTNNPPELGSPLTFPDGTPAGEQASLLTVIRELNREPGADIGLFAFQITINK